jgi:tRNA pseudouridine38-40 synthase
MTLAYDGTGYGGWQVQPNSTSIQFLVQEALATALKTPTGLTGSGRTDAGVHALGQVAHFVTEKEIISSKLQYSLNALLPPSIRILSLEQTTEDFHARYSAICKIYHYHLHLDRVLDPFKRLYSLHVYHKVSLELLKDAIPYFLGTKDFSAFTNEAHLGSAAKDPIRTLKRIDIVEEPGGIRLEFEADGFLYKMVRNITGTLLDICAGHIELSDIESIFASKNRQKAGKTAAAHGLFLVKALYKEDLASSSSNER